LKNIEFIRNLRFQPVQIARIVFGILAAVILAYLVFGGKPWHVVVPEGKLPKITDYVTIFIWYGLAFDLAVVAFLGLTAHWWLRPSSKNAKPLPPVRTPRWFWPLVIIAMVANAWLCFPRLFHSFWHDENYPVRNAILGHYVPKPDGSLKLKETKWTDTLFFYRKPNHTFYSGVVRVLNDTWRKIAKPKGLQFNEPLMRLPAYLAGIASILTIALLLKEMGLASAGVVAAFLSVIHPWHIRYASEARAYGFVLCVLPLVVYFFIKALSSGRWRWWVAFGIAEFFLMYSYPTCVFVLLVLNLAAPYLIWKRWGTNSETITQAMRWIVANAAAASTFLPLMLPCAPQFAKYSKETGGIGELSGEWIVNFLSHLLSGIPWEYRGFYEPKRLELEPWFSAHPALGLFIVLFAVALVVVGTRRMFLIKHGWVALTLILPAVLCFIQTKVSGGHIHIWYLIFLLPGAIAVAAVGIDEWFSVAKTVRGKTAGLAFSILVLGAFTAWTAPQRKQLRDHSLQPNRESVLLTRPTLDPNDPRQAQVITATFYGPPDPYDPRIIQFHNAKELGDLVHRADAEHKELFINLGYLTTVLGEHANKYKLLTSSGMFEEIPLPGGYEPTLQSRKVFRYKPGSAGNFDFDSVPADRGRPGSPYYY